MRRWLVLLCAAFLCQSCAVLPAEERCFVVALCMDASEGQVTLAARVPGYRSPGDYETVEGKGATLSDALAQLGAAAPMQLHYGQVRLVVVSEAMASSGVLLSALRELSEQPFFRGDAVVCITEKEPKSVCDALNPLTGTRLSKSLDILLDTRREQGVILCQSLNDMLLMGGRQCPTVVALDVKEAEKKEDSIVLMDGVWLVDGNGIAREKITGEETQILALISGKLETGTVTLGKMALPLRNIRVRLSVSQGQPFLQMSVKHGQTAVSDEEIAKLLEQEVKQVLQRLAESGCDALGLARKMMPRYQTADAWEAAQWNALYPRLSWRVEASANGLAER